jgi:hypothetical protein
MTLASVLQDASAPPTSYMGSKSPCVQHRNIDYTADVTSTPADAVSPPQGRRPLVLAPQQK